VIRMKGTNSSFEMTFALVFEFTVKIV